MFGVTTLLKSLGVNVTDEHIKQLEILLPQLPAKAQEVIKFNLDKWQQMDARLERLEIEDIARRAAMDTLLHHTEILIQKLEDLDARWSSERSGNHAAGARAGTNHHSDGVSIGRSNGIRPNRNASRKH